MGLLDDAIRDHLELKRRRGAEPGEIARVERAALQPGGEQAGLPDSGEAGDASLGGQEDAFPLEDTGYASSMEGQLEESEVVTPRESSFDADFSTVGQETAELDMQAILGEEGDTPSGSPPAPVSAGPTAGGFEWEDSERRGSGFEGSLGHELGDTGVPEERGHDQSHDAIDAERQERLSFE